MKRKTVCVVAAVAVCAATASTLALVVVRPGKTKEADARVDARIVDASAAFGLGLFRKLTQDGATDRNVFISPASIALSLAMTYNGTADDVQRAMAATLHLRGLSLDEVNKANAALLANLEAPGPGVTLSIANSLWAREGFDFERAFMERNRQFYRAKVANLDFSAPRAKSIINAWIENRTQGHIKEMLDRIDSKAILLLVNAVCFKGEWTERFPLAQTHDGEFTLSDGSKKMVPMMSRRGEYGYLDGEGFQAIRLPYGKGRLAMYVFLPSEETGLAGLTKKLTLENWREWMNSFRSTEGCIALPRFKTEYTARLNEPLAALGMGPAFTPSDTGWRPMTRVRGVFINRVLHKSFLEVNEEGTTATAATVTEMAAKAPPVTEFRMIVNRPFLLAIRDDRTGAALFLGAIIDPAED